MPLMMPETRVGFFPDKTSFFRDGGFFPVFSGFYRIILENNWEIILHLSVISMQKPLLHHVHGSSYRPNRTIKLNILWSTVISDALVVSKPCVKSGKKFNDDWLISKACILAGLGFFRTKLVFSGTGGFIRFFPVITGKNWKKPLESSSTLLTM